MDNIRFSLRQIRYFLAVAEAPTIAAAAARLNISHGALTEALDELEQRTGVRLFVRRRALGVSLTRKGEELLAPARALLQSAADFQASAEGRGGALVGRLAVGCFLSIAPYVVPALIASFRARHPELAIDVDYAAGAQLTRRLVEGQLDCAILYNSDLPPGLDIDLLYRVAPRIVLPAEHPLAKRDEIALADLADEPLIQFDVEPAVANTRRMFDRDGLAFRPTHLAPTLALVRALVGRNLGYAVLYHHPPGDLTYEGRPLAVRALADGHAAQEIVFVRAANLPQTRRNADLRRACLEALAELRGRESA